MENFGLRGSFSKKKFITAYCCLKYHLWRYTRKPVVNQRRPLHVWVILCATNLCSFVRIKPLNRDVPWMKTCVPQLCFVTFFKNLFHIWQSSITLSFSVWKDVPLHCINNFFGFETFDTTFIILSVLNVKPAGEIKTKVSLHLQSSLLYGFPISFSALKWRIVIRIMTKKCCWKLLRTIQNDPVPIFGNKNLLSKIKGFSWMQMNSQLYPDPTAFRSHFSSIF